MRYLTLSLLAGLILGCMGGAPSPQTPPSAPVATPALPTPDIFSVVENGIAPGMQRRAPDNAADPVVARRYVVKMRDDSDSAIKRSGVKGRGMGRKAWSIDTDMDEGTLKKALGEGEVEWVEPVIRFGLSSYTDPGYRYQWDMQNLQVEQVHRTTTGGGVIVAVIDSGVTPTSDGPTLLPGYDFMDGDRDASDSAAATQSPTGSHGTHVANTIGEAAGNGQGCVGVAPGVRILPVRVGDYQGIDSDKLAEGIIWAVDNGAQVINLSMGGNTISKIVQEAVAYAIEKDVVVVAASGNNGYDGKISYPAAYPGVIAVGAHDAKYQETAYSNASHEVDILAPGGDLNQDSNGDGKPDGILQETMVSGKVGYAMMQGTSMAAPHVSGAAALLLANGVKGPEAVLQALQQSARAVPGKSYGALDIQAALSGAPVATRPRGGRPEGKQEGKQGGRQGRREEQRPRRNQ